jgi:hypothetical protein
MPLKFGDASAKRLRLAWAVWLAVIALVVGRGLIWPHKNNCFREHYRPAGLNWFEGNDLYQQQAGTCRYSPFVHAALVPFSLLPERIGAAIWRLVEAAALLSALAWWLRAVCPPTLTDTQRAWLLLLALPLAVGSLNNGQSNVLMTAGILAGTAALAERRWTFAAVALAFACLFKIYPVALALLMIVIYPRQLGLRFALAMAAGTLLPFVLQDPGYVARQYERWLMNLNADDRTAWALSESYRDGWLLVRLFGLPISLEGYRIIQVGMGALLALICWTMRNGDEREMLNRVLGLGCCWMTVFGPATESPTYILLAATLGWLLVLSWSGELPRWTRLPLITSAILFFTTGIVVTTPHGRVLLALGTQPIAALLMLGTLLGVIATGSSRRAAPSVLLPAASQPKGMAA